MNTLKHNITAQRIVLLASKNEEIFHINDLANLWLIHNKNTLRITLKRYIDHGLLRRIYRGMYSILPLKELKPLLIGIKALHHFSYVSTETILYQEGYISRKIEQYTIVSKKSLNFKIGDYYFRSRQLTPKYLYNSEGIYEKDGIRKATSIRAIADMLYFNPTYHFDKNIDWKKVKKIQQIIGYPLTTDRYDFV